MATGLAYSVYLNLTAIPPVEIEPVSVLIADFDNQTGDPLFDGSLEEAFEIGLGIAPFITAHCRRDNPERRIGCGSRPTGCRQGKYRHGSFREHCPGWQWL